MDGPFQVGRGDVAVLGVDQVHGRRDHTVPGVPFLLVLGHRQKPVWRGPKQTEEIRFRANHPTLFTRVLAPHV